MTVDPADRKFAPGGSQNPANSRGSGSSAAEAPARPASPFPDRRRPAGTGGPFDAARVLADPLNLAPNPEISRQREAARPRVMSALAMHLGGNLQGMGPNFEAAVAPLADRFLDIAMGQPGVGMGEPALVRALERDVDALWALSDEEVAEKVARGEPLTGFEPIFDVLGEVFWSVGADAMYAEQLRLSSEAVKGRYDGIDAVAAAQLDDRLVESLGAGYIDDETGVRSGMVKALVSQPTVWSTDGTGLAVTVEAASGPVDYLLELPAGTEIRTDLDVIQAVVEAEHHGRLSKVAGVDADAPGGLEAAMGGILSGANEVGQFVDGIPGAGHVLDGLWTAGMWVSGSMVDPRQGPFAQARQQIEIAEVTLPQEAMRQASVLPFPEELMIGQVAAQILASAEGTLASEDALDLAAELVQDDRANLESEWRRLTSEELLGAAEAATDDLSPLGVAVDDAVGDALKVLEGWDAITQRIGVNVVDFVYDAGSGVWETVTGDVDEGARRFQAAMEAPVEDDVAEYWGLEAGGADAALFATGMMFDPTTWVFGGAKGASKLFTKAMTNPRYAPVALRLGPMRQITRNIADDTGSKAVRSAMSLSGISDKGYVDLIGLARRSDATRAEVEQVLLRELPSTDGVGFFLSEGPRRAYRRSTAQGVSRTLENITAVPAERWPELFRSLTRLDHSRSMHLGESTFLDDFFDMVVTVKPDDPAFLEEWAGRAVDAVASVRGLTDARRGVLAARKQRTRDLIDNMAGARSSIVDDPVGIRQNLTEIRAALGSETLDRAAREQLESMHGQMTSRLARAEEKHGPLAVKSKQLNRELSATTRLEGELSTPESRAALAETVYSFYDDWAQRINAAAGDDVIPVRPGASNPLAPGVPVRDWSAVTGGGRRYGQVDDPTLSMALAGDDADLARQLSTVGMFNRSTTARLPASPYEMVVFEKLATKPKALRQWQQFRQRESIRRGISAVKTGFAANLLLNPVTIGRVHLDETLRYLADTGDLAGFVKSNMVVLPGTGRLIKNPWALQHGRAVSTVDEVQPWDWVERPNIRHKTGVDDFVLGDYRLQAERWVNGSLLSDDLFSQYAKSVSSGALSWVDDAAFAGGRRPLPPPEWTGWWDEGLGTGRPGKANARGDTLVWSTDAGVPVTSSALDANEAFGTIHRAFETWLDTLVDPKARTKVKATLLDAASGTRDRLSATGPDARILNAIKRVPGHPKDNVASLGGMFNLFFGQPSARRGGVFFQHYFDEAMGIYRGAYQNKGRLLTKDTLIERAGMSADEADWAIRQGSDNAFVRWLMDGSGAVTEKTLEAQAARYAGRRSEDLMYQLTASSIAGSVPESALLFPFARASVDFMSWWGNHVTRPMQFRLGPGAREAISSHPALNAALEGAESIPLNVRALARFAHLTATVNNDHESLFDQAVDDLTFLPTKWSREILMGLGPSPGPLPSWLVDAMVAEGAISEEMNEFLETAFPTLGFTDEHDDMLDRIFPVGRTSLRDLTAGAMRFTAANFGGTDLTATQGKVAQLHNMIASGRQPLFTTDFQADRYGEWLADNAFSAVPGSAEWMSTASQIAVDGATEANKADWDVKLKNRIPMSHPEVSEFRALGNYAGIFDDATFDAVVSSGLFDQNDLIADEASGEPRVKAVFERMEAGDATEDEKRWLGDVLATAYFGAGDVEIMPGVSARDWLHVQHPEMAVNLISKNQASDVPVRDDDHRQFVERYVDPVSGRTQNIPPGPDGLDILREARRRGWVTSRPPDGPDGWMRDAHDAVLQSADRVIRGVWAKVTGREWSQDSTTRRDSETGEVTSGVIKALRDGTFEMPDGLARMLQETGLDVSGGDTFVVQEFRELLDDHRGRFATSPPQFDSALQNNPMVAALNRHDDDNGSGLVDAVQEISRRLSDQDLRFEDLPGEVTDAIRGRVNESITLGYITEGDYSQYWEPMFGPLDYEPPVPPPVADLEFGVAASRDDIADGGVEVIDGDTVSIALEDGPMRVRLIGINAPEVSQDGYGEAVRNLQQVINDADEVVLGIYQPELFGVSQLSGPDDRRMLAWLYIDGIPVWDPSVFGADNPRGAGVGGEVLDLQGILDAGRSSR